MAKIGIFWGSSSEMTALASDIVKSELESHNHEVVSYNVRDGIESLSNYKNLIIGCPTWHIGELQDDWDGIYEQYKKLDFSGITAAFFGCGDAVGYPDNFLDAIGLLAKPFMENGGTLIGRWPTEGYEFDNSEAHDGDDFLGLGLDNDNEEELTEEHLIIWAELIKDEFGI